MLCENFQLLPDEVLEALSRIKRSSEGRAVQLPQIFEPDHFHLALWALRASRYRSKLERPMRDSPRTPLGTGRLIVFMPRFGQDFG
jgi:hypothetical protein